MTHIPLDRILPQDMVDMHDHGPGPVPAPEHSVSPHLNHEAAEGRHREWAAFHAAMAEHHAWKKMRPHPAAHRMHVSDARQAMASDPERWTLAGELPPHRHKPAEKDDIYG